jgi:hypothetical protein
MQALTLDDTLSVRRRETHLGLKAEASATTSTLKKTSLSPAKYAYLFNPDGSRKRRRCLWSHYPQ